VEPGDQIKMDVEILRCTRGIWKYKARASVDGQTAVEAELMCTMRSATDASQPAGQ
jgi:3-hydroxyacyl-[acyl-carrier-protein] dehydratase